MPKNVPFNQIELYWTTPAEIVAAGISTWDRIRIYRSSNENSGYTMVQQIEDACVAVTFSINPLNTVNLVDHGYVDGDIVAFSTAGTLPASLELGVIYYVVNATPATFQVATFENGAPIVITTSGTGISYLHRGIVNSEVPSDLGSGVWLTYWHDPTAALSSKEFYYYLIRYVSSATETESKYFLVFKTPSPREARIIDQIKVWVSQWLSGCLTDNDIQGGLTLAMHSFNIYPPVTHFSMSEFPEEMEPLLIPMAAYFAMMFKYLGIAMTDVSYNDNGITLSIDRGQKIQNAIAMALEQYNKTLGLVKMEYAYGGRGVGTIQLPMSLGGGVARGILNIFDIFNATGR